MTILQLHDFCDDGAVREAVKLVSARCVFDVKKLENKMQACCRITVSNKFNVLDEAIGDLTVWTRFGPLVLVPGQALSVVSPVAVEFEGEKLSPEQCFEWFAKERVL